VFERLSTREDAYNYKLGAALEMERTVLEILEENAEHAHDERVVNLLRDHLEESRQHIDNLQEAFELCGWDIDGSPCPAIEGLEKEGKANVKKSDDSIVDEIILQGCVEVEHHEIGVYENLIIGAERMGRDDVVTVLRRNISSEQSALENVKSLAAELATAPAGHSGVAR
jgi:ferritin-like metal-binding protein YciE